jgi:hypothetical protein
MQNTIRDASVKQGIQGETGNYVLAITGLFTFIFVVLGPQWVKNVSTKSPLQKHQTLLHRST